jgi:hypothetical protein
MLGEDGAKLLTQEEFAYEELRTLKQVLSLPASNSQ